VQGNKSARKALFTSDQARARDMHGPPWSDGGEGLTYIEPPKKHSHHPCWYCGGRVIWSCDYDPEGLGYDEGTEGIVSHLHCMDCNAFIEYRRIQGEQYDEDDA